MFVSVPTQLFFPGPSICSKSTEWKADGHRMELCVGYKCLNQWLRVLCSHCRRQWEARGRMCEEVCVSVKLLWEKDRRLSHRSRTNENCSNVDLQSLNNSSYTPSYHNWHARDIYWPFGLILDRSELKATNDFISNKGYKDYFLWSLVRWSAHMTGERLGVTVVIILPLEWSRFLSLCKC